MPSFVFVALYDEIKVLEYVIRRCLCFALNIITVEKVTSPGIVRLAFDWHDYRQAHLMLNLQCFVSGR